MHRPMGAKRLSSVERNTRETQIRVELNLDGEGAHDISTGIPFFDHMLTLFAVHGFFDLTVRAEGDIAVDFHHTMEDAGLVLGDALDRALGDRKGIRRYGYAVTPMDETLTAAAVDLSKRSFLVYNIPENVPYRGETPDVFLFKEFFRAFVNKSGMNLHINVFYGENGHHIMESAFKATGRALDEAAGFDGRIKDVRSSKGAL